MESDATITAALVAAIVALVEAIKWLLQKRANGKAKPPALSDEERRWLEDLWTQHQRCDSNGIPLWYVPRSLVDNQKDMQRTVADNTSKLKSLSDMIGRLERIIDRRRNAD